MNEAVKERRLADHSLVQLTLVRFREFIREPEAVFWTFVFPILLAAGLGIAFRNRPPDVIKVAAAGPALVSALRTERLLNVAAVDRAAGEKALLTGRIMLLALPGPDGSAIFRYDDTNPDARIARLLANRALQRAAGQPEPVRTSEDLVREAGARYIDFLVPGLLGMNLLGSGIWGVGFAIVDARRKKLLKRLVASPMSRAQYLASFLFSRLVLLVAEVAALLSFGHYVFGVPLRGPIPDLVLICLLGSLSFSALGLLLAARPRTIEGVSGLMNLVMLPMWIFSGVFFSAERFPDALQPFIRVLPLTAVIDALRANILQGVRLDHLGAQLAVSAVWLVVCFLIALRIFRWR